MRRFVPFALAAFTFSPVLNLHAQTPLPPPMLPLAVNYRFWPAQYVQWLGNESPYTIIELDVDPTAGPQPLTCVTLVDRTSGKRIAYTADDALVAALSALGEEAHKANLAYEPAETDTPGSTTSVRLTLADGKPLQWRFVQGSEISEQGSGMTPIPGKIPIFAYREQGAVAGEGTALQIGDTVSTAAVWTEISHPPYFVAYHGAEAQSAHTLIFPSAQESWTVSSSPSSLTAGATWELDEARGNHRSLRVDKTDGAHLTVTSTDRLQPRIQTTLEATRTADGWAIQNVRFAPVRDGNKHSVVLQFAVPLTATGANTSLTLLAGKKKTLATGAISLTGAPSTETLTFTDPTWVHGAVMTEQVTSTAGQILLSAHPETATH